MLPPPSAGSLFGSAAERFTAARGLPSLISAINSLPLFFPVFRGTRICGACACQFLFCPRLHPHTFADFEQQLAPRRFRRLLRFASIFGA